MATEICNFCATAQTDVAPATLDGVAYRFCGFCRETEADSPDQGRDLAAEREARDIERAARRAGDIVIPQRMPMIFPAAYND